MRTCNLLRYFFRKNIFVEFLFIYMVNFLLTLTLCIYVVREMDGGLSKGKQVYITEKIDAAIKHRKSN